MSAATTGLRGQRRSASVRVSGRGSPILTTPQRKYLYSSGFADARRYNWRVGAVSGA